MIVYALNKPLDCNRICFDIQQLINISNDSDPVRDKVLTISIKEVIDSNPYIPRLENSPNCSS
jgi:hypothetical protein